MQCKFDVINVTLAQRLKLGVYVRHLTCRALLDDLEAAARYMQDRQFGPCALVGHSLGGAAVLLAAHSLPQVKAVAVV